MLVEVWLAITWFMYSYDPSQNHSKLPSVSNSTCPPSCLVANSILGNIVHERDPSLNAVKCSFLSFMYEMCWDTEPTAAGCPSVGQRIANMAPFYRNVCLANSCYAMFSISSASANTVRANCGPHYDALLDSLLKRDCNKETDPEHLEKAVRIRNFRQCAENLANADCKFETLQFLDTFAAHVTDLCGPKGSAVTTGTPMPK
ncbi:hypothetical protein HDE_06747 [Halotydeus destructor]|nr:hypothetical protein HDE_06747 [Halotydeus destructor]